MSVSTDVIVETTLAGGGEPGVYVTFDADLLFSTLRLDAEGRLWEIPSEIGRDGFEEAAARAALFTWSGPMRLQREDQAQFSLLFTEGRLDAARPGMNDAWDGEVAAPEGDLVPLAFFPALWGDVARGLGEWAALEAVGLPPSSAGEAWAVDTSGGLVRLPWSALSLPGKGAWDAACRAEPVDFHGWVLLADPSSRLPRQAARFAAGRMQWVVPVGSHGAARAPRTLAETGPGWTRDPADTRHAALAAACHVLPTDYTDYGGDASRWDMDDRVDADCSSGCRWWHPLHDPARDGADGDWGVCGSPGARRRGLLTWEHQAGRNCFEGE